MRDSYRNHRSEDSHSGRERQHNAAADQDSLSETTKSRGKRLSVTVEGMNIGAGMTVVEDMTSGAQVEELDYACNPTGDLESLKDGDDDIAPWIRANFPFIRSAADINELLVCSKPSNNETHVSLRLPPPHPLSQSCEECAAQHIVVACSDCQLKLCWRCADAIHIIPAFEDHSIQLTSSSSALDKREIAPGIEAASPYQEDVSSVTADSTVDLQKLSSGANVLFIASDCGRWPQELLHGVVVSSALVTAIGSNGHPSSFCRVIWLRGVESLANGTFRANLVLPVRSPHRIASVVPLDVFPSRLAALRAVAIAEALARRSRRHAVASAIVNQISPPTLFPTPHQVEQIRANALELVGQRAIEFRLSKSDDDHFLDALAAGLWDLSKWLTLSVGESIVQEWEDEDVEALANNSHQHQESWPPPKRELIRFFTLETCSLTLPENERSEQLRRVVHRLLFVYMGFAWARWHTFLRRDRERKRKEHRTQSAQVIQRWCRGRWRRQNHKTLMSSRSMLTMALSMDEIEQTYRQRQSAARSLFHVLKTQSEKRMTRALRKWEQAAELSNPQVQRRIACVQHNSTWHPSHGMSGANATSAEPSRVPLPTRLPRIFAKATPDGRVIAEDVARYHQFRATHAGPTSGSYWLLRGRVLLGAHPCSPSHLSKGKRVAGGISNGGAPLGVGKDPITSILLEQVNAFVCLMDARELEDLEEQIAGKECNSLSNVDRSRSQTQEKPNTTANTSTRWQFEKLIRQRYDALMMELRAGKKRADRQLELALRAEAEASEALETCQASRRSTQGDVTDAELALEMAVARSELSRQHAATAHEAVTRLEMRLEFDHLPIRCDGTPGDGVNLPSPGPQLDVEQSVQLVKALEERLRAGQNMFVFSKDGHGRTGLVGALLFGRLYGLPASEALERVQRHHDCQSRYHPTSTSSVIIPASPHSARQVTLVRAALASTTDAIYASVTRENPEEGFLSRRAAKRGLLGAPLLVSDGGLVHSEPDEAQRREQLNELKRDQRVAARETASQRLQWNRRKEGREREAMAREDENVEGGEIEVLLVLHDVVRRI